MLPPIKWIHYRIRNADDTESKFHEELDALCSPKPRCGQMEGKG